MIGGNTTGILQVCTTSKNEIGESVPVWHDVLEKPLIGWLDLSGGDSKYTTFAAKIEESSHLFLCDYKTIPAILEIDGEIIKVSAENCRMVVDSQFYDVMMIDDPMRLHKQLEIYLKYSGGV